MLPRQKSQILFSNYCLDSLIEVEFFAKNIFKYTEIDSFTVLDVNWMSKYMSNYKDNLINESPATTIHRVILFNNNNEPVLGSILLKDL